jgi:EAL domain-containing protein (putative c-di-GMP-specific phosphodiesterase class I)
MQGYLFSPPRPLAQLMPLIERQRSKLAKSA